MQWPDILDTYYITLSYLEDESNTIFPILIIEQDSKAYQYDKNDL